MMVCSYDFYTYFDPLIRLFAKCDFGTLISKYKETDERNVLPDMGCSLHFTVEFGICVSDEEQKNYSDTHHYVSVLTLLAKC